MTALQSNSTSASVTETLLIKEWNFDVFISLFNKKLLSSFLLTISSSILLVIIRIIVYSLAITGLIKIKSLRFKNYFVYFLLLISLIPEYVLYSSLKLELNNWNLTSYSWFSMITNGFVSFFIFAYTYKIAQNISDAKSRLIKIDNIKWYEKVMYVYLPELKLSYLLLIIFTTTSVWNDYLWPKYLLSSSGKTNITLWFLYPRTNDVPLPNMIAAGAIISMLIPLSTYLSFSKFINKSTR
ncbi:glycerol transporter subunit C [Mycoplasma phocoenae]|nr:glycerol transporter subunit C [Mycoplasma phocoenae]